jgi:hypothetical protein
MVDRRRESEPDLSDDLHPELQRGAGLAPRALWEGRPEIVLDADTAFTHTWHLAAMMIVRQRLQQPQC